MTADLLLAIDQGTTSTRAIAFDRSLRPVASASRPIRSAHPQPGWVEQDPDELLESVVATVATVLAEVGGPGRIAAAGLDNQGETVVAWDGETGAALAPAIVWQCRRSVAICDRLRATGAEPAIRARTGLALDPYFSAGKLTWLLEEVPLVGDAASAGRLRLGTVDAWLTARLGADGGGSGARGDAGFAGWTDTSTASRTQLLSLASLDWDDELLALFGVPRGALPRIRPTAGELGTLGHPRWGGRIRLTAMACDQQAALAGHAAFEPGRMKATYGTGVFVLANAGATPVVCDGIESSVAWTLPDGSTSYVLQGGVFTAGSLLGWLRHDLGLLDDEAASEDLARSVPDSGGVRILPALSGLGAPWYRPDARATIAGLTAAATRAHVARAALDAIAQRTADVVEAMSPGVRGAATASARPLRVDGGLTANGYLMERQADLLGTPVEVAGQEESTALGIAGLAGIGAGLLDPSAVEAANPVARRFEPGSSASQRASEREAWRGFVEAAAALG